MSSALLSVAATASAPARVAVPLTATPAVPSPPPSTPDVDRSRADFAKRIAGVKPGMTANQVIALLGAPDDVKTERDPGGISASRTVEVWRWGTNGHLTFGTLGTVHIQADHRVQYAFGAVGSPPPASMFAEKDLRRLLRAIDAVPSYRSFGDPIALIRAVNALQPLGKHKALAALGEYLRVSSPFDDPGREGTFFVARTLFDLPAGTTQFPTMMVGAPTPRPPADLRRVPRYPIVIVDDIPFSIAGGYSLAGAAEKPESHLEWFKSNAPIRKRPLQPPATPLRTLDRMIGSSSTPFLTDTALGDRDRVRILAQGLRLLRTVFRVALLPSAKADDAWRSVKKAHGDAALKWNAGESRYELADGTFVADPPRVIHQRQIFKLAAHRESLQIVLERKTETTVNLEIRIVLSPGGSLPAGKVRVTTDQGTEIFSRDVVAASAPPGSTGGSVYGGDFSLKEGEAVRVEIGIGANPLQRSEAVRP